MRATYGTEIVLKCVIKTSHTADCWYNVLQKIVLLNETSIFLKNCSMLKQGH